MGVSTGIHTSLGFTVGDWDRSWGVSMAPLNRLISPMAAATTTTTAMPMTMSSLRLTPPSSPPSSSSSADAAAAFLRWAM